MRRVLAVVEICGVAPIAGGRRSLKNVVKVARRARQCTVRSGKCIASQTQVIELGVEPRSHGVARLARCGESRRHVIKHRSLKIFLVTTVASS